MTLPSSLLVSLCLYDSFSQRTLLVAFGAEHRPRRPARALDRKQREVPMFEKLEEIEQRFESLEQEYNDPAIVTNPKEMQRVGKLRAELEPMVTAFRDYKK